MLLARRGALPVVWPLAAGGIAVAAAFAVRSFSPDTAQLGEAASAGATTWLGATADALPLGYAFGAGMVSALNPCGFAMLPAYIAFYLADARQGANGSAGAALLRAVWVSVAITAGFIIVFGIAGGLLSLATSTLARFFPWLGLLTGLGLLAMSARLLQGGTMYLASGERLSDRFAADAHGHGGRAYLVYGLAYGAASLSCTLPVFLAVVASAASASPIVGASQALLYALGMGSVVGLLTVAMAAFKDAVLARARQAVRYVQPASAVLMLVAGAYIVFYWLSLGGLLA